MGKSLYNSGKQQPKTRHQNQSSVWHDFDTQPDLTLEPFDRKTKPHIQDTSYTSTRSLRGYTSLPILLARNFFQPNGVCMNNSQVREKYYNEGWFGRHPEIYDRTDFFMKLIRSKAAQKLSLDQPQLILDVATGTGSQGYEFVKLGHTVVGIDLDIEMLKKARRKNKAGLKLSFIHGDGTNLCFLSNTFDVAVISFAMHDVPYTIGINILLEAKRIIKDSGTIYIVDYEEPGNNFSAKILHSVALIYESPNYKPFIRRGLADYLKPTGLALSKKENIVFGALQLVSLKKAVYVNTENS